MTTLLLVDYGMSNMGSIRRALEICGARVLISEEPDAVDRVDGVILPGVGAYSDGMKNLTRAGWGHALQRVADRGQPLLGICLGMHLLSSWGFEGGRTVGLGLVPGEVRLLEKTEANEKIPHVGWNDVAICAASPLMRGVKDGTDFYFVHSYIFGPADPIFKVAETDYCGGFVSVVQKDTVFGVQFHPEKSGEAGFGILKNFVEITRDA